MADSFFDPGRFDRLHSAESSSANTRNLNGPEDLRNFEIPRAVDKLKSIAAGVPKFPVIAKLYEEQERFHGTDTMPRRCRIAWKEAAIRIKFSHDESAQLSPEEVERNIQFLSPLVRQAAHVLANYGLNHRFSKFGSDPKPVRLMRSFGETFNWAFGNAVRGTPADVIAADGFLQITIRGMAYNLPVLKAVLSEIVSVGHKEQLIWRQNPISQSHSARRSYEIARSEAELLADYGVIRNRIPSTPWTHAPCPFPPLAALFIAVRAADVAAISPEVLPEVKGLLTMLRFDESGVSEFLLEYFRAQQTGKIAKIP